MVLLPVEPGDAASLVTSMGSIDPWQAVTVCASESLAIARRTFVRGATSSIIADTLPENVPTRYVES